jgi:fibronectin-binding autotransporter adhesin
MKVYLHSTIQRLIIISFFLFFLFLSPLKAVNYYSYQPGNWNTANTWTTDPSGTTLVGAAIPANGDAVTILNNNTITLTASPATTTHVITINSGGILNCSTFTFTSGLTSINGAGKLRVAGAPYFPTGINNFTTTTGSTVEYYDWTADAVLPTGPVTYYNLTLTHTLGTTRIMKFGSAATTVNGNFIMSCSGTALKFQIGDVTGTARSLTFNGDVTIGTNCTMNVLAGTTVTHTMTCAGNFTNNGTLNLQNNANYSTTVTNTCTITFTGAANSTLALGASSTTSFAAFKVNKGIDQTYILSVTSLVASAPFNGYEATHNTTIYLATGTLKLGANITAQLNDNSATNYDISTNQDNNAGLWIDGAVVTDQWCISVYGKLTISAGSLSVTGGGSQNLLVTRASGNILVTGGTLNVDQLRPSGGPVGYGTYEQSGGTVNINGLTQNSNVVAFCWPYSTSSFIMSGGIINVSNPGAAYNAAAGGILIGSSTYNITGGTINVTLPNNTNNFTINSTVPFYNLSISRAAGGTGKAILADQANAIGNGLPNPIVAIPLVVLNDLTLVTGNTPTFDVTTNVDQNVTVGGNFNIQAGCTYTPGTNTTTFNGTSAQTFTNSGTITAGLNFLTINKTSGTLTLAGTVTTTTVLSDLNITAGTLADGGNTINVTGNVINAGTHSGAGNITLVSAAGAQTITSSSGIFGNLKLNNTFNTAGATEVTLIGNTSITGNLTLNQNNLFDIGIYNLSLSATSTIVGAVGTTRFIKTAGLASDGGITKTYAAAALTFTFPVGTSATPNYTPATITLAGANPTVFGSITVRPVNSEHPLTTATAVSLTYYWKTTSSGFTLAGGTTVTHAYTYLLSKVQAVEANYVTGRYDQSASTWTKGTMADMNTGTKVATFNATNFGAVIDGDYTAGDDNPVGPFKPVRTFYSLTAGGFDYNNTLGTSWSLSSHTGVATASVPTAKDVVEIGDATNNNHVMVIDANTALAGELKIAAGCTLDISTFTGHNFGTYTTPASGNGTIRIASSTVPTGNFAAFLGTTGGTYEYYGTAYTLPTTGTYYNLVTNPNTGVNITMPNTNITVYGNMTIKGGSSTGITQLNKAATSTLTINGNLSVTSGNLQYQNVFLQNLIVGGDVAVSSGAIFDIAGTGAAVTNTLSIGGNLSNAGTGIFNMSNGTRICNVTFTGTANTSISGTGATTSFNTLTVDKGTSQTALLDVTSTNFALSAAPPNLILSNGTFRFSSPSSLTINPATTAFTIPSTACFSMNSTGSIFNIASANVATNDLVLDGKLQVLAGTVNIGTSGNTTGNDIEYAATGAPSIDVQGTGVLNVDGQIRRAVTTTSGALNFSLAGSTSTVLIRGTAAVTTYAKLEVLNTGSTFVMSGGTLILRTAGGVNFGDLFLEPTTSTVTGGTVQFGDASTIAGQTFSVFSTSPLYNVTINTTNSPVVQQKDYGLTILNNLTIQVGTVFDANSLDVTIGGNLTNSNVTSTIGVTVGGYRAGVTTQTTTFNSTSANQTISGTATPNVTNFGNLVINNSFGSVTLAANTAVTVNGVLTLTNGTLADGGNIITALGNVSNSATHSGAGSITLGSGGATSHTISGSGSGIFGNLKLNSTLGATTSVNTTISGTLTFTAVGLLNIGTTLLSLTSTAAGSISGFGATKYIQSSGVLSDGGVTKSYPASPLNFTFPIGVSGKYTPAQFNVTTNTAVGTINIRPVNAKHVLDVSPAGQQLNYYWNVVSTGFSVGYALTHVYTYVTGDVTGTEASYVIGRNVSGTWTPIGGTAGVTVCASCLMTLTGVGYINGDYTAGNTSEFQAVSTYYSLAGGGPWTTPGSWSTISHVGAAALVAPTGQPIDIASGDIITGTANFHSAYSAVINGTLDLGSFVGHNLGNVSGTGTIKMSPTGASAYVSPAGVFNSFTGAGGGTFEYTGTSGILPVNATYNNLTLSGSGTKTMANTDITLSGNLTISGTSILDNSTNNKNITLKGNWVNNIASANFVAGTGTVTMTGTGAQSIGGTSTLSTFNNLTIKNSGNTVTLNSNATVNNKLDFPTSGYLALNAKTLIMNNWVNGNIPTFGTDRYVIYSTNSIFQINGVAAGTTCQFPMGLSTSSTDFCRVDIANSDNTHQTFTISSICNYLNTIGTCSAGVPIASKGVNLTYLITALSTSATVTLYWDASKELTSFTRTACQVNHHNGTNWTLIGAKTAATNLSGTIYYQSAATTSFSPYGVGDGGADGALPIELLSFDAVLNETKADLAWTTASEVNNDYFTIHKTKDGENFEEVTRVTGAGNSSQALHYRTTDENPYEGVSYYRLKQTDYDGKFVYSKLVALNNKALKHFDFKVFPNPSDGQNVFIASEQAGTQAEEVLVVLYNSLGEMVYSKVIITDNGTFISAIDPYKRLLPGVYIVVGSSKDEIYRQKLVIR